MSAHRVNIPAAAVPGLSRAAAARGMSIASYAADVLLDHALGLDGTATAPAIDPAAVPIPLVTVRLAGDIADAHPAQLWTRGHGAWRIGRLTRSLVRHLGVAQASRSVQGVWRISGWEQAEDGRFEAIDGIPLDAASASDAEQEMLAAVLGRLVPASRNPVAVWGPGTLGHLG